MGLPCRFCCIFPYSNLICLKRQILKEAFVATLVILGAVYLVSFVPLKFELAKPIKQEFGDFDIYDLVFSGKHKENLPRDTSIVLIQVGDSRDEIAQQIHILRDLEPKIIALDVLFENPREPGSDRLLINEILQTPNLVLASRLVWDSTAEELKPQSSFFVNDSLKQREGYINFLGEEYSVVRIFTPSIKINKEPLDCFASKIAQVAYPDKWQKLKNRDRNIEVIDYSKNHSSFLSFNHHDLIEYDKAQLKEKIKDKIVLIGFFTKEGPLVMEDLHFTPMNERISGKSYPDTYGLYIHANILGMINNGKYPYLLNRFWTYCIAGILSFLLLLFVLRFHVKNPHPPHLRFVLIQFTAILLLSWLFLVLFQHYRFKVPLLPIILALVMSVELLGIYKIIARLLNRWIGYRTIFQTSHH